MIKLPVFMRLSNEFLDNLLHNYTPASKEREVYCFTLVRPPYCHSVPPFRHIILSNYISQATDILHEALYRYDVSWDAFSDSSDIYFLFAENLEF